MGEDGEDGEKNRQDIGIHKQKRGASETNQRDPAKAREGTLKPRYQNKQTEHQIILLPWNRNRCNFGYNVFNKYRAVNNYEKKGNHRV